MPGTDLHHPAFYENANDVYPDRELNAYEINHVISTHFNDVRLKNFIEFRHWDSLPVARAERLTGNHRLAVLRSDESRTSGKLLRRHPRGGRVRGQGEPAGTRKPGHPIRQFVGILAGVPRP